MDNRIEDMGGLPPFSPPGRHWNTLSNRHQEGYPTGGFWHVQVVSAEIDPVRQQATNIMCVAGQDRLNEVLPCEEADRIFWARAQPTWELGFENTVTIGQNLRLSARIDARGGHHSTNVDLMAAHTGFFNTWHANNRDQYPIFQAYREVVGREPVGLFRGDFAKLREVSASYTLPSSWIQGLGLSRASVTASGRNLATLWFPGKFVHLPNEDQPIRSPESPKGGADRVWDPEMSSPHGVLAAHNVGITPPTAMFLMGVHLSF